jgi:hypothetical protein
VSELFEQYETTSIVRKITIDPTSASTRQIVITDDEITNGRRCYLERIEAHYDGTMPWVGDATEIYIESTTALGGDRFATIPLSSMSTDNATTLETAGVTVTPLVFAQEGGVASLGVSVVADDDASTGSNIVMTLWIRVSIFPETVSSSLAPNKTATSSQTVQSDLSVPTHQYDVYMLGSQFFGNVTQSGYNVGFGGHSNVATIVVPCAVGDTLKNITLYYEQFNGTGTTATVTFQKVGVDDGQTNSTDTYSPTLSDTPGIHTGNWNMLTLGATSAGEFYSMQIICNSSGNSEWRLHGLKATLETTKVAYDGLI